MPTIEDSPWPLLLLAPLLLYFCARFAFYTAWKLRGRELPFDREMQERGESLLLGQSVRQVYAWSLRPLERVLARARVRPNTLSWLCFLLSVVAGVCIAFGAATLGGVIGLLGSSLDYFDGRVARASGQATRSGGFLDSTLDRYCEVAFLSGAALLFRAAPLTLAACLLALGSGGIVSYTRAKAESLGIELKSGLMQRPERVVMFYAGACVGGPLDGYLPRAWQAQRLVFAAILWLLALLTTHTAWSRTARAFAALRRAEPAAQRTSEPSAPAVQRADARQDATP